MSQQRYDDSAEIKNERRKDNAATPGAPEKRGEWWQPIGEKRVVKKRKGARLRRRALQNMRVRRVQAI
jgi:hypothetical protein